MIPCQRHLFDIPDDVAYLNCAYMSPLMKSAVEAGSMGLARYPWDSDEFSNDGRSVAQLICTTRLRLFLRPATGIATAARNLPVRKDQSILVLAEQPTIGRPRF